MKKYKLHPIGWAIKWALKDCIICIDNYNQKYKLIVWRKDILNKWHVEIGY